MPILTQAGIDRMKADHSLAMRVRPWAIPALIIGIFALDLLTPHGWADWLLYFIPLVLSWWSPQKHAPFRLAALITLLMALGAYLHSDFDPLVALFNRGFGVAVMWGFTWLMFKQRHVADQLVETEVARSQAETRREAAMEARQLAEASATGAIHRESQTARELLVSSLRLEGIIQSAMDAILTVDEQQHILLFNEAAERMFRCPAREAIGQSLERFVPARFREVHHRLVRDFGRSGVTNRRMGQLGTVMGLRRDGEEFPVEAAISHITVEGKKFYTVILRDITERRRLEEQLRRTERVAELGTLASGMAHEIGTPMNVILGRAEYLMDRVADETVKKGLQTIVAQVERITRVMNQLLSFARRKPPEPRPLALRDVIDSSLEMFQERLTKGRVLVETCLDRPCPNVLADADQINQVLINLIMNALHAMPEGGALRIGLAPEKEMVKLTVADTGHGIPKEVADKIFEPFFTTKEFGKGTGLGLTVVKGIIEEHQGSIAVQSEEGKGTMFTILLPVSAAG